MSCLRILAVIALLFVGAPCSAQYGTPPYSNAAFGSVGSLYSDLINRQSVCAFGSLLTQSYSVTATGSGSGGAFTTTNGTSAVPFELQWAQTGGASSGTNVQANVPLTGQREANILAGVGCVLGVTTATVIIIVRAAELQRATAGGYNGTLSIVLAPQ